MHRYQTHPTHGQCPDCLRSVPLHFDARGPYLTRHYAAQAPVTASSRKGHGHGVWPEPICTGSYGSYNQEAQS